MAESMFCDFYLNLKKGVKLENGPYPQWCPTHKSDLNLMKMVREEWKGASGEKTRERFCSHQPASHDVPLHPTLDLRPVPGMDVQLSASRPPKSEGPNDILPPHTLPQCNFAALGETFSSRCLWGDLNTALWPRPSQLAPPQMPKAVT